MQHEIAEEKPSVRAGCGSWAAQWAPAFAGETVLRTKSKIQEAARTYAPRTRSMTDCARSDIDAQEPLARLVGAYRPPPGWADIAENIDLKN